MQNGHRSMKPRVQSMNILSIPLEPEFKSLPQNVPENIPVLRRRKYTKQQRKSLVIEPDISLILAAGQNQSSSSDDDDTKVQIDSNTLPQNRRKYAGRRNMKKRFYSTSNLKGNEDENDENSSKQIGTKSLSVRDLNGDNIDFNNRDSVKKWTSQIFAELESIPSSRRGSMEVTRAMTNPPPELMINLAPTLAPPSPMKRKRFPVFDEQEAGFQPIAPVPSPRRQQEDVVGPTFLRDLLTASCSRSPCSESNYSDRLATSDTATTQKASRASSFEWLENSGHGKYEQCSSDEADREVASIEMVKQTEVLQRKKTIEDLEESVNELQSLGNGSWFPHPPPPPAEARDQIYESLPASFRNRKSENRKNAVGSVYDNAAISSKPSSSETTSFSQQKPIIDRKPFSLENLPMVQRLTELSAAKKNADSKNEVAKRSNTFSLQLAERDAVDACSWLRKAGFSKYADQFEEGKLPIVASKDPTLLEADLRALNRRIDVLNRCHTMKVDSVPMRRRINNEFPRLDPMKIDDNSGYSSDSWRYGSVGGSHHSNTWSRPSGSDHHVYGGSLARMPNSTSSAWHHQMADPTRDSRKVLRTDWYDAQNTPPRGRNNDVLETASSAACVNELNSKLQRSQSERIKDRARAIMKKMDLRSTNKRPKETRGRPAPMNIGDPVLVSYDTPKNSIRSHHIDRPSILPEIKTALPRHHNILTTVKPENLKVNTEKIDIISSSDEPIGRTALTKRSDSGLGSSLSRSPSGPHTQRIRQSLLPYSNATSSSASAYSCCSWGSSTKLLDEQQPFFTDMVELARSIDSLNLIEMTRLRKTAFLRLSSILERNIEGKGVGLVDPDQEELPSKHVWSVQRLIKRMKINDGQKREKDVDGDGAVFGVGLDVIFNRTGYFLPRPILEVMKFLRNIAPETVGIFRKNGVKSRIAELRSIIESYSGNTDVFVGENLLDSTQVHDVADLLKQYFRDLPEPLMTVKMSEVFANICSVVPDVERITALQYAILLLPDENREALKTLLLFLKEVSRNSQVNNMTAQNLSVCFTPSLFQLGASRLDKVTPGNRRHKTVGATGLPSEKEMKEARACQLCLTMLIEYVQTVFMVPDGLDDSMDAEDDNPNLTELGLKGPRSFLVDRVIDLIRDHSDQWKNWTIEGSFRGIEISSKRPSDSHPLKTFRVWLNVPAGPKSVMMRLLKERYTWDSSVINWRHLEYVSAPDTDIHQYVVNETIGHPTKDCHVARFHSSGLTEIRGACAIAERSVKCTEDQLLGGVSATIFDQRFLIEPVSGGQSRVNYIARVDLKGRSLQWYNKSFGSIMCRHLDRLRESFHLGDKGGPETNV
ncbi:START domain-containing protein [Caenorhabditis elegans]|uniref:START domain-containing protein n=1 Tax=Caenorhabditis elegans TaxID=6239 RepID=Q20442_CAEEL|nr:START domain-containing protein [Caenorhabditis elegans]CAA84322.4 START domain-containing protein [Caenorhabditis elegans]|eukprot:NP_497695.3 GEX Interacting protein [Caenorhabditis elegans]